MGGLRVRGAGGGSGGIKRGASGKFETQNGAGARAPVVCFAAGNQYHKERCKAVVITVEKWDDGRKRIAGTRVNAE